MSEPARYRGRFAPSPTGPLHFGSLVAALGSYLRARSLRGAWLVRIEDLDPPRVQPGAADDILRTLEGFGFEWDETVVYQSERGEAYRAALDHLHKQGAAYPCACSRREMQAVARRGPAGPIYPGTCRDGLRGRQARAWRIRTDGVEIAFDDAIQGAQRVRLEDDIGDFVIRRADGFYAYHLALVVDDAAAEITEVVRGSDLLPCSAPQIHLQQRLGMPTPDYAHLPIVINDAGQKLSKQTFAAPVRPERAGQWLTAALAFLGQNPPVDLQRASLARIWDWAHAHWRLEATPRQMAGSAAML